MKLAVISHTSHYRDGQRLSGWGPTVREIDHLATLFDEVVHVAPVYEGVAPASGLPYRAPNVRVVPVPPAGGTTWRSKLGILKAVPAYVRAIRSALDECDVVHVRCPANISLVALCLLMSRRRPSRRWVKYAGNWRPSTRESWSYGLQRWILRHRWTRALVTVNGEWASDPSHVRPFLNPCLTVREVQDGAQAAAGKELEQPVRLLFVGRLEERKGAGRVLEIAAGLRDRGIRTLLEIVGDGPERGAFEARAASMRLTEEAHFAGGLPREALDPLYASAHFMLLPSSSSEGWPKVLSEGMAYGAVPIASDVSAIPQLIRSFGSGRAMNADDCRGFIEAIAEYVRQPPLWKKESLRAAEAARSFAYDSYLAAVRSLLDLRAA